MGNNQVTFLSGQMDIETAVVTMLQGIPLSMLLLNNDGSIRYTNPAFEELSGFRSRELNGQNPPYPFWPDQPRNYTEELQKNPLPVQRKLKRANGTTMWCEIKVTPVIDGNQTRSYIVSCLDISREKRQDLALKQEKKKFDVFFEAIPFPLSISSLPDLNFVNVNKEFLKTGGYRRKEIIGRSAYDLKWVDPIERDNNAKNMNEKARVSNTEMNLLTKDGVSRTAILSTQHINMDGIKYLLSASVDITDRKKVEKDLRESEAFNASLLDNSANPILVSDNVGRIEYVNPALEKLTGYQAADIIGSQPPYKWWPPESAKAFVPESRAASVNQTNKIEKRFVKKNGEPFWVSISHRLIKEDGQVKHFLTNWVDITESKRVQEDLRVSEQNFHDSIENSPLGIRVLNDRGNTLFANKAFLALCGFETMEEYNAVPRKSRYSSTSYRDLLERRRRTKANLPVPAKYELDMIRKDGQIRRVMITQGVVIWNNQKQNQVVYQDITEKTQTERALQESEEKYRTLFETTAQGIIYTDAEGKAISANPAAQAIMGLKEDDLKNNNIPYLKKANIYEDGTEFPTSELPGTVAVKTGKMVRDVVMGMFNREDKKYHWVSIDAVPQFQKGKKKPYRAYITLTDITLIKEAQALSFETEALKRVNRTKTDLLANVSHELRTPLASIKGFIETLLEKDVEWSRAQQLDFLESANREADRLTFLIRDLLDMSRLDAGRMHLERQIVRVSEILETAQNVLSVVAAHHDLQIRQASDLPVIKADKNRIAQVITNLVENACKFSPPGSRVVLSTKRSENDIVFSVKDQGIGMSEETLSQLFNRFYQAQMVVTGKTRGTGLGLSITKGIVESHGGQINVKSKLKEGSLFSFSIPICGE